MNSYPEEGSKKTLKSKYLVFLHGTEVLYVYGCGYILKTSYHEEDVGKENVFLSRDCSSHYLSVNVPSNEAVDRTKPLVASLL